MQQNLDQNKDRQLVERYLSDLSAEADANEGAGVGEKAGARAAGVRA
jgi:hypothetical protein